MKTFRSFSVWASLFAAYVSPAKATEYSSVWFFGDSLTDEGRNGRTAPIMWPQVVRSDLGVSLGSNYAIGGATTSNQPCAGFGDCSFLGQVNSFVASNASTGANGAAGVWIGTNNIWAGTAHGVAPSTLAHGAAADVGMGLALLTSAGIRNVNLLGVYDLSLTNAYQLANADTPAVRASAALASQQYNALLASMQVSGATTTYFNMATYLDYLQRNALALGYTQILPLTPGATCDAACEQTSVFADTIHLSSKTQSLIGAYVASGDPIYNTETFVYGALASDVGGGAASVAANTQIAKADIDAFSVGVLNQLAASRTAADKSRVGEFSAFAYGSVGGGRTSDLAGASATRADWFSPNFTAGLSYLIRSDLRIGAAFGLSDTSSMMEGHLISRGFQGALFGSFSRPQGYIDAVGSFGIDAMSRERTGSFGALNSSPQVNTFETSIRSVFYVTSGVFKVGPLVEASYSNTRMAAFSEIGPSFYAIGTTGQSSPDLMSGAGAEVRFVPSGGFKLQPFLDVEAQKHWLAAASPNAHFSGLPTQSLPSASFPYPAVALATTAGVDIGFGVAWSGRLTATTTLGLGGYDAYVLTIGVFGQY